GAGLLVARGEEGDEVERLLQPPRDLVERGPAAVAECRRLLLRQLGELCLQVEVDAASAVHYDDHRLRRQRVELRRQKLAPIRHRAPTLDVREQLLQRTRLRLQLRIA